jgi:hypothetical protein
VRFDSERGGDNKEVVTTGRTERAQVVSGIYGRVVDEVISHVLPRIGGQSSASSRCMDCMTCIKASVGSSRTIVLFKPFLGGGYILLSAC